MRIFDAHGPIYLATERAFWALGPALLVFIALSFPSQQAARRQATADQSMEIAAESVGYCTKWGMPQGVLSTAVVCGIW